MARKKMKKQLEDCPEVLEKILSLIDKEINTLATKDSLSSEDTRNMIQMAGCVSDIYKQYREDVKLIKADLKDMTKEQLLNLSKIEAK